MSAGVGGGGSITTEHHSRLYFLNSPTAPLTARDPFFIKPEYLSYESPMHHALYSGNRGLLEYNESIEARERRLERNAARMRDKRAKESEAEYRVRLAKNAEANRVRRQNETEVQRTLRLMKNAARQRLRRASETVEERKKRLAKAAERMRIARASAPKVIKPPLADRLKGY
uniref:RE55548p n=1 Tax=Drosophila melanogaster TaxID=7227 RepID=Q7YU58_DROME|nr:RE55548p [Drosophila melanogaster]